MPEMKFEDAIKKLENIVEELERGDLTLDNSLARYEEGIKLSRLCSKKLETAKRKVELLTKSESGKFRVIPFEQEKTATSSKRTKTK